MKNNKPQRQGFIPNRISYIVASNPHAAKELLNHYGYQSPQETKELTQAIKQLVQKKGRKVIKDLIQIHPDKKMILALHKEQEESYCGACSSYSYNPEENYCGACGHSNYTGELDIGDYIRQLTDMALTELENHYHELLMESNQKPENSTLAEELHLVWNEIRKRKISHKQQEEEEKKKEAAEPLFPLSGAMFLGATLVVGILIGSAIKGRGAHA